MICRLRAHRYCASSTRWSHCLMFSITGNYTSATSVLFLLYDCFTPASCIWQIGKTNFMRVLWNIACTNFLSIKVGFIAYWCLAALAFKLSTGNLANSFWMFFYIFLTPATWVSSTNKICVILESRRVCFAPMRITLYEFNTLTFLFCCTPCLKIIQILENESVAVVWVAWAVGLFWWGMSSRDCC